MENKLDNMSVFEQARWYSLMEAVNLIGNTCDNKGIDFNKLKISPLDVQKYIESTCDIYARKIEDCEAKEKIKNTVDSVSPSYNNNTLDLIEA